MKIQWSTLISISVTVAMVATSVYILNDVTTNYAARECMQIHDTYPVILAGMTGVLVGVFIFALRYFVYHYDRG